MKNLSFLLATIISLSILTFSNAYAQEGSKEKKITFSGYIDVYYSVYSDSVGPNGIENLAAISPRSNRFNVNIAQLGVHYLDEKVRGNLVLAYGDLPSIHWDPDFKMIQEANVGLRIAEGWWIDAGFFTTHIGTESFMPKNNFTSSITAASLNEPFYQSGARLSYEGSDLFTAQLWVVNGYNFFLDRNRAKSVGVLLSYTPSDRFSITYTNLFGRESLDSDPVKQFRTYHNLYMNWDLTDKVFLVVGGDLGTQTHSSLTSGGGSVLYTGLATLRYQFTPQYSITGRVEAFNDQDGFISGTYVNNSDQEEGLQLYGLTLSTEYKPTENSYIRLEGRYIHTYEGLDIFYDNGPTNNQLQAMVTMGVDF